MTNKSISGPTNKFDHANITHLSKRPTSDWSHLIPELIDWLADINWPIFPDVLDLLLRNPEGCVEPLKTVFEGDDDALQFYCLVHLVPRLPLECKRALVGDLREFRHGASEEVERDGGMRGEVAEVLEGINREIGQSGEAGL